MTQSSSEKTEFLSPQIEAEEGGKGQIPPLLYKYRSVNGGARRYVQDLVVSQRLYFPGPAQLNDPFECRPYLTVKATAQERRRHIRGIIRRTQPDLSRGERIELEKRVLSDSKFSDSVLFNGFRMTMDSLGIYSLAASPLDLLMWPHYAENHTGICVQFDFVNLFNAGLRPMPVEYRDERPQFDPVRDDHLALLQVGVLTKGRAWAYEREWRLVENRRAGQIIEVEPPIITGVVLGARISVEDRNEVLDWVRRCGRAMTVLQAKFANRHYGLETEQIQL
jgi:hypothetical protein